MLRPIHVVCITQSLGVGGAEWNLVNLINHSDPSRFRYSIIIFDNITTFASRIKRKNVAIYHIPKRGKVSLSLIDELVEKLVAIGADMVETQLFTADIWATSAAKRIGIPTVLVEHNINREYDIARTLIKKMWRNKSDRYVACSSAVRRYMQKTYGITKPIEIIPNGIPLESFANVPEIRNEQMLRFSIIGRLVKQKGHEIALKSFASLKHLQWSLTIIGEGPLEQYLKQYATELRIDDRVFFKPFTDNVPGVLAETGVVLMPSLWEGLGVVAREAMAAGRVVIASDVDGLRESVESGVDGWLVPTGNVADLARRIEYCMTHPNENVEIANRAREKACRQFGIETMVRSYERIFESCV